jgi:hypothetical protein
MSLHSVPRSWILDKHYGTADPATVNGFPVTAAGARRGSQDGAGQAGITWARPGPAKAPEEMNDPAASRGGRARPRSR